MSATDNSDYIPRRIRPDSDEPDTKISTTPAEETSKEKSSAAEAPAADKDTFDYIIPANPGKKKKRKRKRRSKSSVAEKTALRLKREEDVDGYVCGSSSGKSRSHGHGSKHHRKRISGWKKALIIAGSVILALVIVFGATFLIMREIGRSHMHDLDNAEIVTPTEDDSIVSVDPMGQIINYKGKSYELNKDLFSITVIGTDDSNIKGYDSSMGDAIYILTVDTKTGKMKILGVSRDTMADVDVYSLEGKYIDTENKQISYAYSYSSDKVTGGANTTVSLSRLFFNLPLKNYFAINLDALTTINDAIGGVTLTSSITFVSPEDGRTINEGETVTLHGKEAQYYIQTREFDELTSNNERMNRQQQYIIALIQSVIPALKEDISRVTSLYNEVSENSDSNMSLSDIVYISSVVLPKIKSIDVDFVTLTGEITKGEFAEMHVSNDDAITAMLEVFYREIK